MRFRPCIDIHNGKVKQIVGGSLQDQGDQAQENYVAEQDAPFFARLYQSRGIRGGHIILLNPATSPYYEVTRQQAIEALKAYPGGMQIGGGIREDNAESFLDAGASHVIVTSYVFKNGVINWENLEKLERAVGREHLVLDLSCRKKDGQYYIVTDRWQKFTQVPVSEQTIEEFSSHCDEFLVHAVDVEKGFRDRSGVGEAPGKESSASGDLCRRRRQFSGSGDVAYGGRKSCGRNSGKRTGSFRWQYEVGGCSGYLSEE